ncbi:hypothetical protein KCP78_15730 [Salmonella enterica subsp. enterica]|nr:hypothetical protein KCP78_15730 [Salmonella enterica subsp. enterica]
MLLLFDQLDHAPGFTSTPMKPGVPRLAAVYLPLVVLNIRAQSFQQNDYPVDLFTLAGSDGAKATRLRRLYIASPNSPYFSQTQRFCSIKTRAVPPASALRRLMPLSPARAA